MHRLATVHRGTDRLTDGQTDREQYDANSRSYSVYYTIG